MIPPYPKEMAAGYFTTIPCEPNKASSHTESHIVCKIRPVITTLCMLEVFGTFLFVLMSVLGVFVR